MSVQKWAKQLLLGKNLSDKLERFDSSLELNPWKEENLPLNPGRNNRLAFSQTKTRFPKAHTFSLENKRAQALHFFANHELLAIEMMASAILIFPHLNEHECQFKKNLIHTIQDEQKHLQLYINRMNELGVEFGDLPLNSYFWSQMHQLKSASEFNAMMALTFESANLDFSRYYAKQFEDVGDFKSSSIMWEVYRDEISHVAFGVNWFKKEDPNADLWEGYIKSLVFPLTPARSKGIQFDRKARLRAGLDDNFIQNLLSYDDGYAVTQRRQWKNNASYIQG